jgi:tRNA dimethylallyltransferase
MFFQIQDILERKKLPIIVGGTNQFIESLMWEIPLFAEGTQKLDLEGDDLYSKLCEVDPERAKKLHPNDHRKIRRSLEVRN